MVGSGKSISGFHGTTIQAVVPKPSVKNTLNEIPQNMSNANETSSHAVTPVGKSRSRSLPSSIIKSLKEPEDKIGEPSDLKINKFSHLNLENLSISNEEEQEWENHKSHLSTYNFIKSMLSMINLLYAIIQSVVV